MGAARGLRTPGGLRPLRTSRRSSAKEEGAAGASSSPPAGCGEGAVLRADSMALPGALPRRRGGEGGGGTTAEPAPASQPPPPGAGRCEGQVEVARG